MLPARRCCSTLHWSAPGSHFPADGSRRGPPEQLVVSLRAVSLISNSYLDTFLLFHHETIHPRLFIFLILKHSGEFDQVGHQVHHRHHLDQFSLQMLDMCPGLCSTVYLICFLYFIFKLNCFQFQHFQNLKIVAAWQINQIFDTNFGNFFYKLLLQN